LNTTKYLCAFCLVTAAALRAWAAIPGDDAQAVQGNWQLIAAELGGRAMPDALVKIVRMKLADGRYEVTAESPDVGTYTLEPAVQPKRMTVTGTEGPNRGKTFPAIYEVEGDTLRICYDLSGAKRPNEFKTAAGTKLYLATYRRAKE
jgi:uncharacterized protein (TIGR03067 family)